MWHYIIILYIIVIIPIFGNLRNSICYINISGNVRICLSLKWNGSIHRVRSSWNGRGWCNWGDVTHKLINTVLAHHYVLLQYYFFCLLLQITWYSKLPPIESQSKQILQHLELQNEYNILISLLIANTVLTSECGY